MNNTAKTGLLLVASLCATLLAGCDREPTSAPLAVRELLSAPAAGFERALAARPFDFPADHGPHPGFRDEWWYATGNLRSDDGRRFGFQITFFRHQLRPGDGDGWDSPQAYMAHFALSDIDGSRYHHFERFGRPGAGVAGARTKPFAVWLDGWRLASIDADFAPLTLQAEASAVALDLRLEPTVRPVLQGEDGLSRKNAEPGNASYYYSLPRIEARGRVRDADGYEHTVHGLAWLDREWSSSALGREQAGWDWFALQPDDGPALMYYQLRRADGSADRFSAGTLIATDGSSVPLTPEQVQLQPLQHWTSPAGQRYPIAWRLRIPQHGVDWQVRAALPQQWFDASFRYWEGAVEITRSEDGKPLGSGYLEMTGYE